MSDKPGLPAAGEFLLYETEDGRVRVECRFAEDTLWLSQGLMAELFQTTPQNVTQHLKALYAEGEITPEATCKEYLQVRAEGSRTEVFLRDWASKLDDFLRFNDRRVLGDAGKVSHAQAIAHAEQEYEQYAARRQEWLEAEGEAANVRALEESARALPKAKTRGGKQ